MKSGVVVPIPGFSAKEDSGRAKEYLQGYARLGLGDAFLKLGRRAEALAEYRKVPASLRNTPEVALRIGACALTQGEVSCSIRVLRRQFQRNRENDYVAALLARCYAVIGRFSGARELAEAVLQRNPDFPEALKAACMAASGVGDVEATLWYSRRLMQREPSPVNTSYYLYHLLFSSLPPADIETEYIRLRSVYVPPANTVQPSFACDFARRRIRVGYVSALFGVHAEHFQPIFAHHDRDWYEVHAFAGPGRQYDEGKQKLEPLCDAWHPSAGASNVELADRIRKIGIDVLVDCDGHFQWGERLGLYAYRAAPVQVSFLYPHRTGALGIDCQITDHRLSPDEDDRSGERLIRLPIFACHQVPACDVPVSDLPALRNGFVTFGSFSPPLKMNEAVIEAWCSILKRVPRSRMILHSKLGALNGAPFRDIRRRLVDLFAKYGVNRRRLILVGNRDLKTHLEMYHKVDIALDPFPHNGMRTTFMALWMGVPVLTKLGDSMVSRMGASLVSAAGLSDWVACDVNTYVEEACSKAADPAALAQIRRTLRARVEQSLLMDGEKFTRALESAFEKMIRERHAGLA